VISAGDEMRGLVRGSRIAILLVAMVSLLLPARAPAQSAPLQGVSNDVASMGVKLKTLIGKYDAAEVEGKRRKLEERVTDAEILFLLGDYQRASLALYEFIADRKNTGEPAYPKGLYYLAESLYQMKHDQSAKQLFQQIVERRDRQFLEDAVRRLIQIADRNENWNGLEEHVGVLEGRGHLPPGIAYIRAKSLLRQGLPGKVKETLAGVPPDHELALRAAYVNAVASLQAGELDVAREQFERLAHSQKSAAGAAQIRDLAAMNQGRILLEQGRFGESADAYQYVARTSPLFEEALFEVTWTYVRAANAAATDAERVVEYKKAMNALEILLLAEAENPIAPEARLLLGNIRIKVGQLEQAEEVFDEVVDRYGRPRDELNRLIEDNIAPEEYFEAVSGTGGSRGVLSPLAVHWARDAGKLRHALGVLRAIDESDESLRQADDMISQLMSILDSGRRASFFPGLKGAQGLILEYGNTLVSFQERLTTIERGLVQGELGDAQRAELEQVLAQRAALEPEYRKLPQQKEEYEGRVEVMRGNMLALQQQAYRLKYDIDSMRAQLNGLKAWIGQHREMIADDVHADYSGRIATHLNEVEELEKIHRMLEQQIATEKALISVTSEKEAREEEVRARYSANLESEREILSSVQHLAAEAGQGRREIERLREVIGGYNAELEGFKTRIGELVALRSVGLKEELAKERRALQAHRDSMVAVREEAKQVVGEVAKGSLREVQKKFQALVLRADVGIVDVAWAKKEMRTHEISQRVAEQRRELQILDQEFSEVLSGD